MYQCFVDEYLIVRHHCLEFSRVIDQGFDCPPSRSDRCLSIPVKEQAWRRSSPSATWTGTKETFEQQHETSGYSEGQRGKRAPIDRLNGHGCGKHRLKTLQCYFRQCVTTPNKSFLVSFAYVGFMFHSNVLKSTAKIWHGALMPIGKTQCQVCHTSMNSINEHLVA